MLSELKISGLLNGYSIIILLVILLTLHLAAQKYLKGLNKYPGPFAASLTDNWRLFDVWKRNTHITYRRLHERYGDIVRVAPNVLSFGDPKAIPDIYGLNKGYTKVSPNNLSNVDMATLLPLSRAGIMMSLQH